MLLVVMLVLALVQNYLSLSGQTITANPIDLSGTNATGTLAATRFSFNRCNYHCEIFGNKHLQLQGVARTLYTSVNVDAKGKNYFRGLIILR